MSIYYTKNDKEKQVFCSIIFTEGDSMSYFIGIDLGTSSCKLLLCNDDGAILKTVTKHYEVTYPQAGWSEQNPEDWWEAFKTGMCDLTVDISRDNIRAIAVAGQMHSLVILDKNDCVIRPAILWNDGRTFRETEYLNAVVGKERLSERTANIAFAGFTAPKLLWIKANEPKNFEKIVKIMLPKDYINYRLTGVHACDYSDASGMLLLDVQNRTWSKEMLEICGVTEKQMPHLFESYQAIGTVLPKVAAELGLSDSVIVAAGAGDNAAAAVGTGTVGEGRCNISLGTSGTVFVSSNRFRVDEHNALHAFCHADGGYHLMGCMLSAASCNQWFCEKILGTNDYAGLQRRIAEESLGKGDVFFLPYLMGERSPINDTDATGVFVGLRPNVDEKEMLLAVLEGVCFAIRDNMEIIRKLDLNISYCTVSGGGAKSKLWMKILANVLNTELRIPVAEEGPALGAVRLASVACGDKKSVLDFAETEIKEIVYPETALVEAYEKKYRRFVKIYPKIKELFKEIKVNPL